MTKAGDHKPGGVSAFNLNPGGAVRNDIWQTSSAGSATPSVHWYNQNGVGWLWCYLDFDPGDWLDCCITWNKTTKLRTLTVYNLTQGVSNSVSAQDADTLVFGDKLRYGYSSSYLTNVRYDEVMLWNQDATPEQIQAWYAMGAPFYDPREVIDAGARPISLTHGLITKNGLELYDRGQKVVFTGYDPATGNIGGGVNDYDGEPVVFWGQDSDGRRGFMMQKEGVTWLTTEGIEGNNVLDLPWNSLDALTKLMFDHLFEGNFILQNEDGSYGFDFGEGASQIKSYILKATRDAYVNSLKYEFYDDDKGDEIADYTDDNYGSAKRLVVGNYKYNPYGTGPAYDVEYLNRAYIGFDFKAIPSTEEVINAELRLYRTSRTGSGTDIILRCFEQDGVGWTESGITWNNQPYFDDIEFGNIKVTTRSGINIISHSIIKNFLNYILSTPYSSSNYCFVIERDPSWIHTLFEFYSREGHSTNGPTLVVYTQKKGNPTPGLSLYVPGGRVYLNRKIFEVSGKSLTLDPSRSDIAIYVYEDDNGEAVIDFAHAARAFKADSYAILGTVTTDATKITGVSALRKDGRKEGPKGYGNDVFSFGYPGDDEGVINISTTIRNPELKHYLGGSKHRIMLEILPAGQTEWQLFQPMTYTDGSNKRGITVSITSDSLLFDAGTTSIYRYTKADGSPVDVTAAQIRGIITRLD